MVAKTSESNSSTIIKRRHSEQESTESKKARLATNSLTYENSKAERSLSLEEDRKPAPISAKKTSSYLSESKKFTALRKEKLDQFLNLKTDNHHHEEQQKARDQIRNSLCRPGSENSKNDLPFGIKIDPSSSEAQSSSFCPSPFSSPLKVEKSNSSSNSGDLKPAETPCPTAATVKLDDSFCFEAPNPIRFPVNKSLIERMICKWTDCGIEEDSAGKLLDHLKVNMASTQINRQGSLLASKTRFGYLYKKGNVISIFYLGFMDINLHYSSRGFISSLDTLLNISFPF